MNLAYSKCSAVLISGEVRTTVASEYIVGASKIQGRCRQFLILSGRFGLSQTLRGASPSGEIASCPYA